MTNSSFQNNTYIQKKFQKHPHPDAFVIHENQKLFVYKDCFLIMFHPTRGCIFSSFNASICMNV